MRDFYDVYLIYTKYFKNINIDNFKKAIDKTFSKREYARNPLTTINLLRDSQLIRLRQKNYQRKYEYAKSIAFDDILNCIEKLIDVITLEKIQRMKNIDKNNRINKN